MAKRKGQKPKVRMAAMAPSIGPRKSGKVRGGDGNTDAPMGRFGGGKITDRGIKR